MPGTTNKRRSTLARFLLWASTLLSAALVFTFFAVQTDPVQMWVLDIVKRKVEARTGLRVAVGDLKITPLRGTVGIEGLDVIDPDSGESLLMLREFSLVMGLERGKPLLREIVLVSPVLQLHLEDGGIAELEGLDGGGVSSAMDWGSLKIVDGAVTLYVPDGRLEIEGLNLLSEPSDSIESPNPVPGSYRLLMARLAFQKGRFVQEARDIRWDGVIVESDRFVVPSLALNFPGMSVRGSFAIQKNGPISSEIQVSANLSAWDSFMPERLRLQGTANVDVLVVGDSHNPEISADVELGPWTMHRRNWKGTWLPVNFGPTRASLVLDLPDTLVVEQLYCQFGGGGLEARAELGLLDFSTRIDLGGAGLGLAAVLVDTGVAPDPWVDWTADLEAHLDGSLSPISLVGSFSILQDGFRVQSQPVRLHQEEPILEIPHARLAGSLELDDQGILMTLDDLELASTRGRAEVYLGFKHFGPLDVHLDIPSINYRDLSPVSGVELAGHGLLTGDISGPFSDLKIQGTTRVLGLNVMGVPFADDARLPFSCPDLRNLHFFGFRARKGETSYSGNLTLAFGDPFTLDTQVIVENGRIFDLSGMFVELPVVDGRVSGSLELSGEPYSLDGSGELDLRDVSLLGEYFPSGQVRYAMREGRFTLSEFVLERFGGEESILVRGSVGAGYTANFDLLVDGVRLERLDAVKRADLPVAGSGFLALQVGGTLKALEPRGRLALVGVESSNIPVDDSLVTFDSRDGIVEFKGSLLGEAALLDATVELESVSYDVHLKMKDLPLHLLHPLTRAGDLLKVLADGELFLSGVGAQVPDMDMEFDSLNLSWRDSHLRNTEPWLLSLHDGALELKDANLVGSGTDLLFSGQVGHLGEMNFDTHGTLDLRWLKLLHPEISRAAGKARVDLGISGNVHDPGFEAEIDIEDAFIKTGWFPHTFEDLNGKVRLTPDEYTIEGLNGRVGGGALSVRGKISAQNGIPTAYNLQLDAMDARLHYIEDLPPMLVDTTLSLDGQVNDLLLSGRVDIRDMVFSDRIDWESWVLELKEERLSSEAPDESADYFSLGIDVVADGTARIRNNVGNARLSANLRVMGDTSRPGLLGDVRVETGGRAYLKEREFEIMRGEMHFIDPYRYDPELDLMLQTDVQSKEDDYRVYYRVTGPFSDWQSDASSEPALSQADINWLLLFGATREELEEYGTLDSALAWESMDLLSHELGLASGAQKLGAGILRVDRWDIVTGATNSGSSDISSEPRLVVEKDLPPPWELTVTGEFKLVEWGDTYASVEKRVARRLYLKAYWASVQEERYLNIGGAYGTEFKLRWELD